jgi:hypothetical protein
VCLANQIHSFSSSTKSLEHLHPKAAKTLILLNLANQAMQIQILLLSSQTGLKCNGHFNVFNQIFSYEFGQRQSLVQMQRCKWSFIA